MTIRAERDPRFYLRFLLIGLAALGFALWRSTTGTSAIPSHRSGHSRLRSCSKKNAARSGTLTHWSRGWSTTPPTASKPHEEYEVDVKMQFWMAALAGIVSFFPLFAVWNSRGRWIEWSNNTLTSSWGQTVTMDQVEVLEKRQWRNKGIAKLRYNDGGKRKTFVIDDFKFKRAQTDEILVEIEKQIGHDKITGGPPEGYEVVVEPAAEAETTADA